MNSAKLHDWLQLVGMAAIVLSLIFVGLQLRQSEHAALVDLTESSVTRGVEMSTLMSENADVWLRACADEELSSPERIIANNIYFRYFQGNFNSWIRYETTGVGPLDSSFLIDAFAANIHRYPGFRKMALSWTAWAERGARVDHSSAEQYKEAVFRRLSELEKEEPNPSADIAWCGIR
jgi:hypothetical protein